MTMVQKSGWNAWRRLLTPTALALAALTLVGYGLRQYGAQSSINYIPDTQIIREALDIGQALAGGHAFDVNIDGGLKYPLTLPYFLLGVYGLVFAGGFVTGSLPTVQAFTDFLFLQRETVHLISVAALNLINVAAIPLAFVAGRGLEKRHTGWLAAGLVTVDLIVVQFSHQARPHAPLATFMLLAVVLLAAIAERRGPWWLTLAASAACGLAIGTLQTGIAVCVPFGLVWLARLWEARQQGRFRPEMGLFVVNLCLLVGLGLFLYPTLLNELLGVLHSLGLGSDKVSLGGGQHQVDANNFTIRNMGRFVTRISGYQPVPVLLMPAALVYFLWQFRSRPKLLLAVLPIPLGSLAVWFSFFAASRYWSDLSIFMDILGAYFLEEVVRRAAARWQWPQTALLAGVAALVLGPAAVQAGRLAYVLGQPDTRSLVSQWFEANVPAGTAVVSNFQLLELLPAQAGLRQQQRDFPGSLGTYGQWLLKQKPDSYPKGRAFEIIDYTLYWPEEAPSAWMLVQNRKIEYTVVQTTANFITLDNRLLNYSTLYGQPVAVFCPGAVWEPNYLPTDIYATAWQAIWAVNHPGPIVVVFKLGAQPQPNPPPLACP